MFTGIIENVGVVSKIIPEGSNIVFWIESSLSQSLRVDQSLAHNGVCLTVEAVTPPLYKVTAVKETLDKSNLSRIRVNDLINLERSVQLNGRLDGHIVQGHVDAVGSCVSINSVNGSYEMVFRFPEEFAAFVVEKGSVSLNGISLTVYQVTPTTFTVAIIPYTYEHTNLKGIKADDQVNLEFDIVGKYVHRLTLLYSKSNDQ